MAKTNPNVENLLVEVYVEYNKPSDVVANSYEHRAAIVRKLRSVVETIDTDNVGQILMRLRKAGKLPKIRRVANAN